MRPAQLIAKKRDGAKLSEDDINRFIQLVVRGGMQEAQTGAMLMAMFLRGLEQDEVHWLTRAMMCSGETLSWPMESRHLVVDKHSTGGVGDKISIPLAPLLAAVGLKVPMISGRGLGHTGGTLDKMECIPGYQPLMDAAKLQSVVNEVGCAIAGQTENLVVADKILYSLRDITSTVNHDGLILSSIMSKKAAEGIKNLVLDLKVGPAGLFPDVDRAREIAQKFIWLSSNMGINCVCVGTNMTHPLGSCVGNSLEVIESIDFLKNRSQSRDLHEIVMSLGSCLVVSSGLMSDDDSARRCLEDALKSGAALEKFRHMIVACGTSPETADTLCSSREDCYASLPTATFLTPVKTSRSGVVRNINAMGVAELCNSLGAGRTRSTDSLDLSVGLRITAHLTQSVHAGDVVAELHSNSEPDDAMIRQIQDCFEIDNTIDSMVYPDIILAKFQA